MTLRWPEQDRGAAAVVTTLWTVLLLSLVWGLLVPTARVMVAADRARVAADAAALAVLSGSTLAGGTGQPALDAGRQVAVANGAALDSVDSTGWPVTVTATVVVDLDGIAGVLGRRLNTTAAARLVPGDVTVSNDG